MPDPYSSFGEGLKSGVGLVADLSNMKAKQDEQVREKQKMQFDEMRKTLETHAQILKSDVPAPIREAAANGILNIYRKNAKDMGIDPANIPESANFDHEFSKTFANQVMSMNKLYEKGIIGRNDYRVGMFQLGEQYKEATGKENQNVTKMGDDIASKDQKTISAIIGDQKVMLQETSPGSGQFAPMKTTEGVPVSGPAAQRIEVVKPPTEGEREKIATARADIELYDSMITRSKAHPNWTGMGKDLAAEMGAKFNMLSPEHNQFVADVKLNKMKDYKFFLGTAQSKNELKNAIGSIPDLSMPDKQFAGAVAATKANKQRMLDRTMEVLAQSGIRVPTGTLPEDVAAIYQRAKASGQVKAGAKKPVGDVKSTSGRPSLETIFLQSEGDSGAD